ncbi:MAG: NYN domain-containing protein [Candidatus Marinimicrobia bacterium]|jgi:predicted RNA-binding protein with PIN domain|nr:NYN domain-containing protein [Candidatus Neomarinimicrobiota bacterium]MDP6593924.1 NYN domain-containing protein [Candidatus Neomarinimicrobiota bacterium]MDP6837104.1 NYN domain-containing protein [Candidatus Neomarinimicrobiota bacterium]|tara:strand:+ start:5166 stop:5672 length:507 start_codon:yes stop_codon:yes gene_type:complete
MIRYIIDGHNFIHTVPRYLTLLDRDYPTCLKMVSNDISDYCHSRKIDIFLVFDGNPPWELPRELERITLKFSGKEIDADALILKQAAKWRGRQTIVVTADRKVEREVTSLGCQVISPQEFDRLLKGKRRGRKKKSVDHRSKDKSLSQTEVAWWRGEMEKELQKKKNEE